MEAACETKNIAKQIRIARLQKGLSRQDIASALRVDVSAVASWEVGRYLPRDTHRAALAKLLGIDLRTLVIPEDKHEYAMVSPVRGIERERLLAEAVKDCRQLLIVRVASPFLTMRHKLLEFRQIANSRLLDRSLEVRVIEIVYKAQRLEEIISNVFRYADCSYSIKTSIPSSDDVLPGIDGYIFDKSVSIISSFWPISSTDERPAIQATDGSLIAFLGQQFKGLWDYSMSLNPAGTQDLSAIQEIAANLGVPESKWPEFVEKSKGYSVGDGVPPAP